MNCPHCRKRLKITRSVRYAGNIRIRRYDCAGCGYTGTSSEELKD